MLTADSIGSINISDAGQIDSVGLGKCGGRSCIQSPADVTHPLFLAHFWVLERPRRRLRPGPELHGNYMRKLGTSAVDTSMWVQVAPKVCLISGHRANDYGQLGHSNVGAHGQEPTSTTPVTEALGVDCFHGQSRVSLAYYS